MRITDGKTLHCATCGVRCKSCIYDPTDDVEPYRCSVCGDPVTKVNPDPVSGDTTPE